MKKMLFSVLMFAAAQGQAQFPKTIGQVIRLDPALDALIAPDAKIEVLADGFQWSEGPVWVPDSNFLLFSDVPRNTIFKWKEGEGVSIWLQPSGYTGRPPYSREPGSNGLTLNRDGWLVACEHGDRRVTAMPLQGGGKVTIAQKFNGKRFNSPNDVVQKRNGDYYFTDPPYGLPQQEKDPSRETKEFGVYRVGGRTGRVNLLVSDLTRPNGLCFSPDEKTLYVAQSDPEKAYIMAYTVLKNGLVDTTGRLLFDATPMVKQGLPGLPDGLRCDKNGNLFATGPGGVLVISPEGKLLGRIDTTQPTANCAWGDDGSTLYMTANNYLMRIRTKTSKF